MATAVVWPGRFLDLGCTPPRTTPVYIDALGANPHAGAPDATGLDGHVDQPLPATSDVATEIARGGWSALHASKDNGLVWSIPNIDASAKLVWSDHFNLSDDPGTFSTHYQIFRSKDRVIPWVPLPSWTVFIDQNGNGILDPGERAVQIDANGNYTFQGLDAGTYKVAQVPVSGWVQADPANNAAQTVVLGAGSAGSQINFIVNHPSVP